MRLALALMLALGLVSCATKPRVAERSHARESLGAETATETGRLDILPGPDGFTLSWLAGQRAVCHWSTNLADWQLLAGRYQTTNGLVSTVFNQPVPAAFFRLQFLPANTVCLAWDPSPDANVTGYAISYGTNSGSYQVRLDVGAATNTQVTLPGTAGTWYFVATAYTVEGVESLPSNEVSWSPL